MSGLFLFLLCRLVIEFCICLCFQAGLAIGVGHDAYASSSGNGGLLDESVHPSAMMDGVAEEAHAVVRRFVVLCSAGAQFVLGCNLCVCVCVCWSIAAVVCGECVAGVGYG